MRGFLFDILKMAVGEYARGYGFSLQNPVSIRPEYLWLRFGIVRCMQKLQKMKIFGMKRHGNTYKLQKKVE